MFSTLLTILSLQTDYLQIICFSPSAFKIFYFPPFYCSFSTSYLDVYSFLYFTGIHCDSCALLFHQFWKFLTYYLFETDSLCILLFSGNPIKHISKLILFCTLFNGIFILPIFFLLHCSFLVNILALHSSLTILTSAMSTLLCYFFKSYVPIFKFHGIFLFVEVLPSYFANKCFYICFLQYVILAQIFMHFSYV